MIFHRKSKKLAEEREKSQTEFSLPLTATELIALFKLLHEACESDKLEASPKAILTSIRNRISRFADRQGAWWDNQGEIITSTKTKIE